MAVSQIASSSGMSLPDFRRMPNNGQIYAYCQVLLMVRIWAAFGKLGMQGVASVLAERVRVYGKTVREETAEALAAGTTGERRRGVPAALSHQPRRRDCAENDRVHCSTVSASGKRNGRQSDVCRTTA